MFKQALASGQSHQSGLHCSRTCAKWAYIWYIPAVDSQTRMMSMCEVSLEPSLLSRMHKMGVHKRHILSVNAQTRLSMRTVSSEPLRLAHWQNECRQRIRSKSLHVYRSNLYMYNKYPNGVRWLKYNTCSWSLPSSYFVHTKLLH